MSDTLARWITEMANGEAVEGVVIDGMNRVLMWEEAKPLLRHEFLHFRF